MTVCRTPDEAFAAGMAAAAKLPPPTPEQIARVVAILVPYLQAQAHGTGPAAAGERDAGHTGI
jgi:hypothetical protein